MGRKQRRQFLQNSVLVGITVGAAGCTNSTTNSSSATQNGDEDDSSYQYDDSDSESYDTGDSDTVPEAPPRESEMFEAIELDEKRENLVVTFESSPVVEARLDGSETMTDDAGNQTENRTNEPNSGTSGTESGTNSSETGSFASPGSVSLASILPVGVAQARGRGGRGGRGGRSGSSSGKSGNRWGGSGSGKSRSGRGSSDGKSGKSDSGKKGGKSVSGSESKTGGGSGKTTSGSRGSGKSSFRGRNGRFKWHGGHYAMWQDRYGDEVEEYATIVNECGIGYIGSEETSEDDLPGTGPIEWDNDYDGDHTEMQFTPDEAGWYRVGARLQTADGEHDFGWEAVDVKIVEGTDSEWEIDSQWKVSPRL